VVSKLENAFRLLELRTKTSKFHTTKECKDIPSTQSLDIFIHSNVCGFLFYFFYICMVYIFKTFLQTFYSSKYICMFDLKNNFLVQIMFLLYCSIYLFNCIIHLYTLIKELLINMSKLILIVGLIPAL